MDPFKRDYERIEDNLYQCRKCGGKFSVIEIPCGVSGPGCKDSEEVYCPHCCAFIFSKMIAGHFIVTPQS